MNFYKLRFINTVFLLMIGVAIGFLLKKTGNKAAGGDSSYKPVYSSGISLKSMEAAKSAVGGVAYSSDTAGEEKNPMDEEEDYMLPVVEQSQEKEPEKNSPAENVSARPSAAVDEIDAFVKNPETYSRKDVSGKLQMIIAKKLPKGWRLNFVYADENKNLNYLYVDDPENVSGEKPDFKIGYFYYVKFYSGSGDPKKDNTLLLIYSTGEKTQWASGVSAVE